MKNQDYIENSHHEFSVIYDTMSTFEPTDVKHIIPPLPPKKTGQSQSTNIECKVTYQGNGHGAEIEKR